MKQRDNRFDNLKALLIFLMILGHAFEQFENPGVTRQLRAIIYCFHMPAFIFISGYFSRRHETHFVSAVGGLLLPYLLFNSLWVLACTERRLNLLLPVYAFWYLLSLFFWRAGAKLLRKIPLALPLSILLSLAVGCFGFADRTLSLSRTIAFLPFFLAGELCSDKTIDKIRAIPRKYTLLLLIAILLSSALLDKFGIIPVKAYENLQCYEKTGMNELFGVAVRAYNLLAAGGVIICLFNLISDKCGRFTKAGSSTFAIYIGSAFVLNTFGELIKNSAVLPLFNGEINSLLSAAMCLLLSGAVFLICANKYFRAPFDALLHCFRQISGVSAGAAFRHAD